MTTMSLMRSFCSSDRNCSSQDRQQDRQVAYWAALSTILNLARWLQVAQQAALIKLLMHNMRADAKACKLRMQCNSDARPSAHASSTVAGHQTCTYQMVAREPSAAGRSRHTAGGRHELPLLEAAAMEAAT
jgi:hypothetical protein